MADKRKKLSTEKEAELLISEWVKHPCLYQKSSSDCHNRNKRDIAKERIAANLNDVLAYDGKKQSKVVSLLLSQ